MLRLKILFLFLLLCSTSLIAEEAEKKACEKECFSETSHTVVIDGKTIPYKAIAGNMILNGGDEKKASFFFIYYTRDDVENRSDRPIAFCTNGGPGSSSVWLHLGVLGPKRVNIDEEGYAFPPYQLVDNAYSILDETDLVFIDPVSTGYSQAVGGTDAKKFHGVEEDISSVADFIQLFLNRYNRWESPKLFFGESYGTTRAAGLANHLHNKQRVYLNGVALISTVLNFQTHRFDAGNDLPYQLILPSYTAAAWYHKKLPPELQGDLHKALKESEEFAMYDYPLALMKGDRLSTQEKRELAQKLSRLTGLSPQYLEQANLRVEILRFAKELLRNKGRTVGRFDSRYIGIDSDSVGESIEYDPSADAIFGAFTSSFNHYIRDELNWKRDEQYEILANVWPWSFGKASNKYLNVADDLRETMTRNPKLKVFVASGYYDLATPYFAADYTLDHLNLDPSLRGNISTSYYEAGHMFYTHKPSLIKFKRDLKEFVRSAAK